MLIDICELNSLSFPYLTLPIPVGWVFDILNKVTDKSRMAYVDSELAKRSSQNLQASTYMQTATQQQQPSSPKHFNISQTPTSLDQKFSDTSKVKATVTLRQPVTLGMLQEIDLGDEARERNVKMTEQATRRLDGEMIEDEQEIGKYRKKGGKMKSGKDGNSWWERKKRRGDDIKRDQLVDQVLRENRRKSYISSLQGAMRSIFC